MGEKMLVYFEKEHGPGKPREVIVLRDPNEGK